MTASVVMESGSIATDVVIESTMATETQAAWRRSLKLARAARKPQGALEAEMAMALRASTAKVVARTGRWSRRVARVAESASSAGFAARGTGAMSTEGGGLGMRAGRVAAAAGCRATSGWWVTRRVQAAPTSHLRVWGLGLSRLVAVAPVAEKAQGEIRAQDCWAGWCERGAREAVRGCFAGQAGWAGQAWGR